MDKLDDKEFPTLDFHGDEQETQMIDISQQDRINELARLQKERTRILTQLQQVNQSFEEVAKHVRASLPKKRIPLSKTNHAVLNVNNPPCKIKLRTDNKETLADLLKKITDDDPPVLMPIFTGPPPVRNPITQNQNRPSVTVRSVPAGFSSTVLTGNSEQSKRGRPRKFVSVFPVEVKYPKESVDTSRKNKVKNLSQTFGRNLSSQNTSSTQASVSSEVVKVNNPKSFDDTLASDRRMDQGDIVILENEHENQRTVRGKTIAGSAGSQDHFNGTNKGATNKQSFQVLKECVVCTGRYRLYNEMEQHLKTAHGYCDAQITLAMDTMARNKTCSDCNLSFPGLRQLKRHRTEHHSTFTRPKLASVVQTGSEKDENNIEKKYARYVDTMKHKQHQVTTSLLPSKKTVTTNLVKLSPSASTTSAQLNPNLHGVKAPNIPIMSYKKRVVTNSKNISTGPQKRASLSSLYALPNGEIPTLSIDDYIQSMIQWPVNLDTQSSKYATETDM